MLKSIISILIYHILFTSKYINCSSSRKRHYGKCVYISTNTGSKIINFHKYKNKFSPQQNFSINICNDTIYEKMINETKKIKVDSQIVYYENSTNPIRLAGPFYFLKIDSFKNISILDKFEENNTYIYKPQLGDFCDNDTINNYSTNVIFEDKNIDEEKIEIFEYPNASICNSTLKLNFNKEYATDYLLLQIVLNNAYIFTGIVFILLGIFLSFLSFHFKSITKIVISVVFGQLLMFNIAMICIGNATSLKEYLYILIIGLGLLISVPFIYFTRTIEKLYSIILSFSAGYICGIFIYEIFFFNTNSVLSQSILIDVLLISTTTFIGLNSIVPRNSIYYPPFIGSYILIRGFSLFIYNITDKGGFGDLHLLIYLIELQETDLVDEYFQNDYKYFYVYLIFIGVVLIASEVYILIKNKDDRNLSFSDLEEDDSVDVSFTSMNKLADKSSE